MTDLQQRQEAARRQAKRALDAFPDFDALEKAARSARAARLPQLATLCRNIVKTEEKASEAYSALAAEVDPIPCSLPRPRIRFTGKARK